MWPSGAAAGGVQGPVGHAGGGHQEQEEEPMEQRQGVTLETGSDAPDQSRWHSGWPLAYVSILHISKLTDEQDKMQRTPLYLAAKYNHLEVMEILLKE